MAGGNLARTVAEFRPAVDSIVFWRLGQSGLLVRMAGKLLLADGFFAPMPGRLIPPPIEPEDIPELDYVIGTHDHPDHIDRFAWPVLAKVMRGVKFLVPGILADSLAEDLGIVRSRFIEMDDGVTVKDGPFRFTGAAAAHETLAPDPVTGRYPCIGVIAEAGGRKFFQAGDCCPYEGLETRLRKAGLIDIMFLPINGRDAKRLRNGILGNFSYQEAAELAGALGPVLTVPVHYDMFEGNLEDPRIFADYLDVKFPKLRYKICEVGEMVTI